MLNNYKNMKYIIGVIGVFIIPIYAFANSQIDIETSDTNIELGDSITITVSLNDINLQQSNAEISLPWVENFDVFSQSVSNSFQNINGVTQNLTQLIIQLTAKNTWDFELGPVEILWDEILRDNEKINISVRSWWVASPSSLAPVDIQNTQEIEQNLTKDVLWWWEEDLRGLREMKFPVWAHGAFLVFFIGAFYLLLSYVLKSDKSETTQETPISQSDKTDQYKIYFKNLSEEIWDLSSEDFFHLYNVGLRKIFWDLWVNNHFTATLMELTKNSDITGDLKFELFKKSYKHEYSWVSVSQLTQKKYIDDILSLLS